MGRYLATHFEKINSDGTEIEIRVDRGDLKRYYDEHSDGGSVFVLVRLKNINDLSQISRSSLLELTNDIKLLSIAPNRAKVGDTIVLKGYGFIPKSEGSTYINIGDEGVVSGREILKVERGEYREPDSITFKLDTLTSLKVGDYKIKMSNSVSNFSNSVNLKVIKKEEDTITKSFKIKKTGQTKSYYKFDDGYYQKGVRTNYTRDNAKEIVTDHLTGLMWQDDSAVASVKKPWVTQANYYDTGDYSNTTGETATTYCDELVLGGFEDWRLPTRKELVGIADYGRYNPAINVVFVNTNSYYYWSSTSVSSDNKYEWIVDFSEGRQYAISKNRNNYVRCVRAGE